MNGFVTGLVSLSLTNGKNYFLPCDIEWGIEGKYLIFPIRYYKAIADDLFTVKNIQISDGDKVICILENPIRTENGQEFYDIAIYLDKQNYDKILKSGVADNTTDVSLENIIHEEIPEAILEKEETKDIPIKRSEIDPSDTIEHTKLVKKPKWYKFWRYFW